MSLPATFTGVKNSANQAAMGQAPNINNDAWYPGQQSVFLAGQLYCDLGAFAQATYDPVGKVFTWDNVDIRYAKTGVISGTSVVYGITANNNPTVQDVWNTVPPGSPLTWARPSAPRSLTARCWHRAATHSKSAVLAATSGSTAAFMRKSAPMAACRRGFSRIGLADTVPAILGWTDRHLIGGWPTKKPGTRTP